MKTYFIKGRKSDIVTEFINEVNSSISPLMTARHRVGSCNNQFKPRQHYLQIVASTNNYKLKANSLPSILDSEIDEEEIEKKEDINKSPTSTASYGKKKSRSKPWKYLQRQRTTEEMTPLERDNGKPIVIQEPLTTCEPNRNGVSEIFEL